MAIEPSVQLGVTRVFQIKIYNPETGEQIAADSAPVLNFTMPNGTIDGPYSSALKAGTTGTYLVTHELLATSPEGEWIGEWTYQISGNNFKPRFTFHAHLISFEGGT